MFFCRARSRQSTTRRIAASCFFCWLRFFGTRKIYLLSTDCMWALLSPVDGHNPFTTWGCKTSIYEFLYQNGDSWRRISPTVCLLIKFQSLEPLVEGHICVSNDTVHFMIHAKIYFIQTNWVWTNIQNNQTSKSCPTDFLISDFNVVCTYSLWK